MSAYYDLNADNYNILFSEVLFSELVYSDSLKKKRENCNKLLSSLISLKILSTRKADPMSTA